MERGVGPRACRRPGPCVGPGLGTTTMDFNQQLVDVSMLFARLLVEALRSRFCLNTEEKLLLRLAVSVL